MDININLKNRERIAIAQKLGQPDQVPIDFSLASQFNYLHGWPCSEISMGGNKYLKTNILEL